MFFQGFKEKIIIPVAKFNGSIRIIIEPVSGNSEFFKNDRFSQLLGNVDVVIQIGFGIDKGLIKCFRISGIVPAPVLYPKVGCQVIQVVG